MGQKKRIEIISPVDAPFEAEMLIEAGATALYGGMFPSYFEKYPYFFSPNQRTFKEAQMDEKQFAKLVEIGKKFSIPTFLTINQTYFLKEQIPLIIKMAKDAQDMGVDGFIMGSIPLILHIKNAQISLPINISTMAVVLNGITASFYKTLEIRKITLPRSLLIEEIKSIISKNEGLDFDTFILVGKCPNVEGLCGFLHTNPEKIWPCEQFYEVETCKNIELEKASVVQKNWQRFPRSHGCGICAIPELIEAGISGLKIVGRGSAASFKKANVELVVKAIKVFAEEKNKNNARKILMELYRERFGHDCSSFVCYFPEIK